MQQLPKWRRMTKFDAFTTHTIATTMANPWALKGEATNGAGKEPVNGDGKIQCKQSRLRETVNILHVTDRGCIRPYFSNYSSLLQGCLNTKSLPKGKQVHAHIIRTGCSPDTVLGTQLVIMYAKCGCLMDACRVLDEMPERNVVSWTAVISAYSRHGLGEEALALFHQMQQTGVPPDQFTFASVVHACTNLAALEHGKRVHEDIISRGFQTDVVVGRALVDMYVSCGRIEDARNVFDKMSERSALSWSKMAAAYAQNGLADEALKLFQKMPERDVVSWNVMIAGYAKVGQVNRALEIFQKIPQRDVISWNAMVAGYAQNQRVQEAVELFQKMPERNVVSWNTMIAGFGQNGCVGEALVLFQKMPEQNRISWNAMIAGYARNGQFSEALRLYRQMHLTSVKPNSVTFISVLPACANLGALEHGKNVHKDIIRNGFQSNMVVGNALLDMYAKCGSMDKARHVFDKMSERDVVSWTAMIAGYEQDSHVDEALKLFQKMPERNVVSWTAMVAGYAQSGHVREALKLFQEMPERNVISWNTMITGYAQNGYVGEALKLFQKMPERDVVSWNAMIAGCAQNGYVCNAQEFFRKMPEQNAVSWNTMISGYAQGGNFNESLKFFQQMKRTGVRLNSVTYVSVLSASANLAALEHGKQVHKDIIRCGFLSDIFVGNALVDMYAKCGSIDDAGHVFDKMVTRDAVSWNAMIVGYAIHGRSKEALRLFEQMQNSGAMPDHITFVAVLSACCHAGLVVDGWQYFGSMSQDYHITPAVEHYCCMVDLLGRAGWLSEARDFINRMPMKPDAAVWGSLLSACKIHNNVELGELVAKRLFELDPKNSSHYVLLSNIYAASGRWDDVEKVRKLMKDEKVKKMPGCSWIEVNNKVHAFHVGDRSHPQTHKIYAELENLFGQMKEAGYIPDVNSVLHDVEEEQKERVLYHHSEKLAIAFGLICTSFGTPIRIVKNLRVCGDCHSATKFISKIVVREIVVRDASRFHHFKDGRCSCGDYW